MAPQGFSETTTLWWCLAVKGGSEGKWLKSLWIAWAMSMVKKLKLGSNGGGSVSVGVRF